MARVSLSVRAAIVLCLVFTACANEAPPPYRLEMCDGTSEADRATWEAAATAWNRATGYAAYTQDDPGECGHVRVCKAGNGRAQTLRGACNITIEYRDGADLTAALHELGHALLTGTDDDHREGSAMRHDGGGMSVLTAEDGRVVREHWGWPDRARLSSEP